ncbi:MAG: phage scaffolding protein [Oscillospiraceae bacterium]|nr:phage scaffolding protein [Oscillospiraceae bacterium]
MQRKFLEDLGLEKDVVDKIITENTDDINNTKKKLEAERDNYKSQLETAQTALKDFEGIDVKELNSKIATLTADLAKKDSEYQSKIADMEFNSTLDTAISNSKAKNSKAVRALLDLETLKSSKNQSEDIKTALEKVKSENDYLFETTSVPGGGGNPPAGTNTNTNQFPKGTVIF